MSKNYYWLKLETDFFNQKEIKKLRRIAGGDTYTIIYLKMALMSLKDDGIIYFDKIEDTIEEELALELDEEVDNVRMLVRYLAGHNMLETNANNDYYMNRVPEMTGTETDSARRTRKHRQRKELPKKTSHCNTDVTSCDTEKRREEIEKSREEVKHLDYVLLKPSEYESLIEKYGKSLLDTYILKLDTYLENTPKKREGKNRYRSHYKTLLTWMADEKQQVEKKQCHGIIVHPGGRCKICNKTYEEIL